MADLSVDFAGIKSPNPFWLASAPPTNMGSMVERAFDAGWGGAVWKTLGEPIATSRRGSAAVDYGAAAHDGPQQHRAHHRPPARGQPARDREVKKQVPEARASSSR